MASRFNIYLQGISSYSMVLDYVVKNVIYKLIFIQVKQKWTVNIPTTDPHRNH